MMLDAEQWKIVLKVYAGQSVATPDFYKLGHKV